MLLNALKRLIVGTKDEFPKLPTETILTRLSDCRPPGDKRMISEYMEMIEIKLEVFPVETARDFFKFNGIQIMFKIMKAMKNGTTLTVLLLLHIIRAAKVAATAVSYYGVAPPSSEQCIRESFTKMIQPEAYLLMWDS